MNKNLIRLCSVSDRTSIIEEFSNFLKIDWPEDSTQKIMEADQSELYSVLAYEYAKVLFNGLWVLRRSVEDQKIIELDILEDITYNKPLDVNTKILDIGCGPNRFKSYFGSCLIGIDPFHTGGDYQLTLEEYSVTVEPKSFDAIIAQGSLNFGSKEKILGQMKIVNDLLKDDGVFLVRFNIGYETPECPYLDIQNEWTSIEEVHNMFKTYFNKIIREHHNPEKSLNLTLKKR